MSEWDAVSVVLRLVLSSACLVLGCATSTTSPPNGPAPLELDEPKETRPPTTDDVARTAGGETKSGLPPELQPCSETNPQGCRAPSPSRETLDRKRKYAVEVRVDDPSLGPATASVVAVVFSDFQCPFCARLEVVLDQLKTRYPTQLRIVWKDLPLSNHTYAMPAALLAREAYVRYGNEHFWTVHDELFLHQNALSDRWLASFAVQQKLSWPPSEVYLPRIEKNIEQADQLGIAATPTVFINGRPVVGAEHVSVYADLVEEELE